MLHVVCNAKTCALRRMFRLDRCFNVGRTDGQVGSRPATRSDAPSSIRRGTGQQGARVLDELAQAKARKRENKNRPVEMSSKRPVPRLRQVL